MTTIDRLHVLQGHTSPETAYLVNDYPYGWQRRCKIRYWVETARSGAKRDQQRFVSQTTNPRRPGEIWNSPKPSVYDHLVVMYLDDDHHVHWVGLISSGITPQQDAYWRLSGIYDQLTESQHAFYNAAIMITRRRFPRTWQEWDERVRALAESMRTTGQDPQIHNGIWTSPIGPCYLGNSQDVAAYLVTARQHLAGPVS